MRIKASIEDNEVDDVTYKWSNINIVPGIYQPLGSGKNVIVVIMENNGNIARLQLTPGGLFVPIHVGNWHVDTLFTKSTEDLVVRFSND